VAIGVIVEGYAMGRAAEDMCAELLRALGEQATAKSVSDSARLRVVGNPNTATPDSPEGEASS